MAYQFLDTGNPHYKDPGNVSMRVPDDCYGLYLNCTNNEWWGKTLAMSDRGRRYARTLSPGERRVLDTIDWVAGQYQIDRNRIYLCGVSMGGCGTLSLGLSHGDIFAAVRAWVPAGTDYAAFRRGFPPPLAEAATEEQRLAWTQQISGMGRPDPPVVVDISSQTDQWSKSQPVLLEAARAGRLPLVLVWGPFGHSEFRNNITKYPECAVALEFPWMEIRKDAAYPVFTNSSSDQRSPWLDSPKAFDESGQINALFRWENELDQPLQFGMELWIAHPAVKNPPPTPDAATVDVTLRRLQRFRVLPGTQYAWRLVRDGRAVASGTATPDAANLLCFPRLTLTTFRSELLVKPIEPERSDRSAEGTIRAGSFK